MSKLAFGKKKLNLSSSSDILVPKVRYCSTSQRYFSTCRSSVVLIMQGYRSMIHLICGIVRLIPCISQTYVYEVSKTCQQLVKQAASKACRLMPSFSQTLKNSRGVAQSKSKYSGINSRRARISPLVNEYGSRPAQRGKRRCIRALMPL
jgi:hypothetical protein